MKETITPMSALPTLETGFVPDSGYMPSTVESATMSRHSRFGRLAARSALAFGVFTGGAVGVDALGASSAHADTVNVYTVDPNTAAGGVYARSAPDSSATQSTYGYGVWPGDSVEVICGITDGTPVGPYNNTAWDEVTDLNNPSEGSFWLNAHYIDDGAQPSQLAAGESECKDNEGQTPQPQSAFFSPFDNKSQLPVDSIADIVINKNQWAPGNCDPTNAVDIPSSISTLGGWSIGRLGPIYFLDAATDQQKANIHTIELFDPGNTENFSQGCDSQYDINDLLAGWLSSNSSNRLIVYTGEISEEGPAGPQPGSFAEQLQNGALTRQFNFSGLWKYYFAGIWNQPFADQALVCDYAGMSHADVFSNFAYTIQDPQQNCPVAQDGQQPVAWNP